MNHNERVDDVHAVSPLVLAVLTITISTDTHGWLSNKQAVAAVQGVAPASADNPAAVIVNGLLQGCDSEATRTLASALYSATYITLYARGPGVTTLARYLRSAIAQERVWQAEGCR